jgi:hypothetical protein
MSRKTELTLSSIPFALAFWWFDPAHAYFWFQEGAVVLLIAYCVHLYEEGHFE